MLTALPAVWPLTEWRYLESHDGTYHLLRVVELDTLVKAGEFFSGWFPDFGVGYGYPLLRYYPPLSYYPAEMLHLLGFGIVDATKAALALPIVLSGIGAYLLGKDLLGSRLAGWVTAAGFMYAPYHIIDTYVRAILSESWAFPFMPLLLWSLRRAIRGSRAHIGLAGLWLAGLILAHNVIALFFLPVALAFGAGQLVFLARLRLPGALFSGTISFAAAISLGLLIASAYWLPALSENVFVSTVNFNTADYRPESHLNQFSELISDDLIHEYAQSPFRFGLLQAALTVAGLAAFPWAVRRGRATLLFGGATALLFGLLLTPAFVWIWSLVPLIAYVQFPTRLLGVAAIGTALATGGLALFPAPLRYLAPFAALALVVSGTGHIDPPLLYPRDADLFPASLARFEYDSGIIGTTTAAEYLPVWARAGFVPPTEGFAVPSGTAGDPALRVSLVDAGPLGATYTVDAEQAAPLRFHSFYFPGWTASIDGATVPTRDTTAVGLLTVDIPAGRHQVSIGFSPTLLRMIMAAASIAGLFIAAWLVLGFRGISVLGVLLVTIAGEAFFLQRVDSRSWTYGRPDAPLETGSIALSGSRLRPGNGRVDVELFWQALGEAPADRPLGVRLEDSAGRALVEAWNQPVASTSPTNSWHKNEVVRDKRRLNLPDGFAGGTLRLRVAIAPDVWSPVLASIKSAAALSTIKPPGNPVSARFGGKYELTGFDIDASGGTGARLAAPKGIDATLLPGDTIKVRLVWKTLKSSDLGYTVFVHLVGPDRKRYAQQDNQPAGGFYPTVLWQPGQVVEDEYLLKLPKDAPPGAYHFDVGMYWLGDEERLPIENYPDTAVALGHFKVAGRGPDANARATFGDTFALLDARRDGSGLMLSWKPLKSPERNWTTFVQALDAQGRIVNQADGPPLGGGYPTSYWSAGEVVQDARALPAVPDGGRIVIGWYDPNSGERLRLPTGEDSYTLP